MKRESDEKKEGEGKNTDECPLQFFFSFLCLFFHRASSDVISLLHRLAVIVNTYRFFFFCVVTFLSKQENTIMNRLMRLILTSFLLGFVQGDLPVSSGLEKHLLISLFDDLFLFSFGIQECMFQ